MEIEKRNQLVFTLFTVFCSPSDKRPTSFDNKSHKTKPKTMLDKMASKTPTTVAQFIVPDAPESIRDKKHIMGTKTVRHGG